MCKEQDETKLVDPQENYKENTKKKSICFGVLICYTQGTGLQP